MKRLLIILLQVFFTTQVNSSGLNFYNIHPGDSIDIKKWSREDFRKNFRDSNDSAYALINLFFTKNKRGKTQTILGGAFLIGGITAMAIPSEPGDDQKGFGDLAEPVAGPGAATLGIIFSASGIIKLGKYTKQKLFILLTEYKNGIPIPKKYKNKLKRKYFKHPISSNPKD